MFTVVTEKGTIRVEFEHERYVHQKVQAGGQTVCKITQLPTKDPDDEGRLLGTGIAQCHVNDNWVYAKGRKLALARAVRKAFPKWNDADGEAFPVLVADSIEMRLLIWNCYHLTVSGGARFVQPMTGSLTGSYRGFFQYTTQGGTT